MESVGQKLRTARLRSNLRLDEISATTRISIRNLEAIESDQVHEICSRFTYRSFARQFATAVHIDWSQIEPLIAESAQAIPPALMPGENGAPLPPAVPSLRPKRAHRLKWALSVVSLCVVLGLCSGLYGAWQNARTDLRGSVSALLTSLTPHSRSHRAVPATAEPKPMQVAQKSTKSPSQSDGFLIQLSGLENCWLSVVTDGKEVFSGVLQPSEKKTLHGHDEARVRAGNAGGVDVNFNGRELGPLGHRGEVRTVVFTRNGYEVLDPEANASPIKPAGE